MLHRCTRTKCVLSNLVLHFFPEGVGNPPNNGIRASLFASFFFWSVRHLRRVI